MNTTITPPPLPPAPPAPPVRDESPAEPPRSSAAARVISILTIVFGSFVVVGTVLSALWGTLSAAAVSTTTRTVSVDGVENLDLSAAAGTVRVEFAAIDDAELQITAPWGSDRWTIEVREDDLVVASPDLWEGARWWFGRNGDAVLRLPESLAGLDADLHLAGGELIVDGAFDELDLQTSAGSAEVSGSAIDVTAGVSAGRAQLDLDGVREASLSVSAGAMDAGFTGRPPAEIAIDLSAGALNLVVPDGEYLITEEVSAGNVENRIGSTPGARSTIDVQTSAGQVVLRTR